VWSGRSRKWRRSPTSTPGRYPTPTPCPGGAWCAVGDHFPPGGSCLIRPPLRRAVERADHPVDAARPRRELDGHRCSGDAVIHQDGLLRYSGLVNPQSKAAFARRTACRSAARTGNRQARLPKSPVLRASVLSPRDARTRARVRSTTGPAAERARR
jgi:hypothetical protein